MTKTQIHTNISEEAARLLKAIAKDSGVTMTAVLELMIRAEAKRRKIE